MAAPENGKIKQLTEGGDRYYTIMQSDGAVFGIPVVDEGLLRRIEYDELSAY